MNVDHSDSAYAARINWSSHLPYGNDEIISEMARLCDRIDERK